MDLDIRHLQQWIGRKQASSEILTPTLVNQFNATFNRTSDCAMGNAAPLLIHFCLAQPISLEADLGPDGHPTRGDFLPPVPLPRRMWAGGDFTFHDDIHIGETVTRHSTIRNIVLKQGRTGVLCFVTVDHEIISGERKVLSERQDIVYRDVVSPAKDAPAIQEGKAVLVGTNNHQITPTATLLFRYSAMTFNGHRIHYDKPYVTKVEGYPGLIVHGPMQATLLCQYAADLKGATPKTFKFRSLSPIFDDADFTINAESEADEMKLWTAKVSGPVAMEAHAKW